jgi:hypothetical protein
MSVGLSRIYACKTVQAHGLQPVGLAIFVAREPIKDKVVGILGGVHR